MNVDVFKIKKYDSRIKYYFRNLKKKKTKQNMKSPYSSTLKKVQLLFDHFEKFHLYLSIFIKVAMQQREHEFECA